MKHVVYKKVYASDMRKPNALVLYTPINQQRSISKMYFSK